ncbi:MAG: hypothetical protein QXK80_00795 [Candidatus Pacearchaeota archaeon]
MSEVSPVYESKIVHAGIFDFKTIYNFLYDLFTYYNYVVIEQKYSEKIKAEGKELEILWLCLRKINDYFRFRIKVRIFIVGMSSVEVVRENVKVKRDKGEIEVKIASYLEKDYENKWETNPVTKFLRGIYDKYIIKSTIEAYEDAVASEVDEILSQLKSYLALEGRR